MDWRIGGGGKRPTAFSVRIVNSTLQDFNQNWRNGVGQPRETLKLFAFPIFEPTIDATETTRAHPEMKGAD